MQSAADTRVLVIEDDVETAHFLMTGLGDAGFVVDWERDGAEGLLRTLQGNYSMIVLDRMLPGKDGLAVVQEMRARQLKTPVIVLSAIGSTNERVKGLRAGSDDYLVKPFDLSELIARIEALSRRSGAESANTILAVGELSLDVGTSRVTRAGKPISLHPREFRLLRYLLRNHGHVVTRSMIIEELWGYNFDPGTNIVEVHVSNLRKKIDAKGAEPLIHTVRGAGYLLGKLN
ncbi:MAG: response regulator transcription factor [Sphingomonas sp.]